MCLRISAIGFALLLASSLAAQERRAFEPGGSTNLVKAGQTTHQKEVEEEVIEGFSITMDSSGRVTDAGGKKRMEKSLKDIYSVTLFVDEQGARQALVPFKELKGKMWSLSGDEKFQNAIIEGAFPKMLVLNFTTAQKGRDIRENLASELGKRVSGSASEMGKFVSYFRKDFKPGDEAVIRLADGQRIMTTVLGEQKDPLQNADLAGALLKMWMGRSLVSDLGPLLE
jgi:hypothetical protein